MSDLNCTTGTTIGVLQEEVCNAEYKDSQCVIQSTAIPYLNLPANTPLNVIINTLILALQYKDEQISNLQDQIDAL